MCAWFSSSSTRLARIEVGRGAELEAANRDVLGREAQARIERANGVLVEGLFPVADVARVEDVALARAQGDLERRAAIGVFGLHVEVELVRLDADVVDRRTGPSQDSRDKASVCGQKFSSYKGLPHYSRKPHVPGFKFFLAKNV